MINTKTGEFKLDSCRTIIHPELLLVDFQRGDIAVQKTEAKEATGYTKCVFVGVMDGLEAEFIVTFRNEHLYGLVFADSSAKPIYAQYNRELNEAIRNGGGAEIPVMKRWGKILSDSSDAHKRRHDDWLASVIGGPPPYEYQWGAISSGFEPHSGSPIIGVEFKYQVLEREPGITDLKAYFEARRKESARMAEKVQALDAKPRKVAWWNPVRRWLRHEGS